MKAIKWSIAVLTLCAAAGSAMAGGGHHHHHGGHVQFGIAIGGPYWGGSYWGGPYWDPWYPRYYAPYPYYSSYYAAPAVVDRTPPVYIQQPAAPQVDYWYYCGEAKAYYPYVKECSGGWQKVLPQTPRQP